MKFSLIVAIVTFVLALLCCLAALLGQMPLYYFVALIFATCGLRSLRRYFLFRRSSRHTEDEP